MSHTQDPYYLVREEIQDSVSALQDKYGRLEKLPSGIPEFRRLKSEVEEGCESISWQVDQLQRAIDISEKNPSRFNLSSTEISDRKAWAQSTRQKLDDVRHGLAVVLRAAASVASEMAPQSTQQRDNDHFIGNQQDRQMQIMRQQDDELDELGDHVTRIGHIGLTIHEELDSQGQLLEELDNDMDATQSRLAAAQKKINTVLQKAGAKGQMCIILVLSIILVVLVVFTFS